MRITLGLCLLLLSAMPLAAQKADVVFLGENILTMDDALRDRQPTAVAISGDEILWLGSRGAHDEWLAEDTEVVELGQRALLPGFIDAHGHFLFTAATVDMANVAPPPVGDVTNIAALQRVLLQYVDDRQPASDQWIVGFGYDDSLLEERRHPTVSDLDVVSTTNPILLSHVSGHLIAANSAALEIVGIDANTPDPAGGIIRRDEAGNPNGVLEETATARLRPFMASTGDFQASFDKAVSKYASNGITTVQEGYASPQAIATLQEIAARKTPALDFHVYAGANPSDPQTRQSYPFGTYRNRVKIVGIKMSLDGSPQGKTAYLSKPYHVAPDGQDAGYRGYPTLPEERTNALVAHYRTEGLPIIVHANGDAAGDMLIGAVERTNRAATAATDHRTVMIHAQTMRHDQVVAMARLQMIPSYFSAHTFYWGDWHRDSVLGPDRAANISPARWTLEAGGRFTVHNDAPVVPPDMIRLLWSTTNRLTRTNKTLGEAQRVSVYAALRAMTADAAYQAFDEDIKGTIAAGKQADLVLLSRNPLQLPTRSLLDIEVQRTYSAGKLIYAK